MEEIINKIGPFGKFQLQTCLLIGFSSALTAMTIYTTIFSAASPKLICNYANSTNGTITDSSKLCSAWSNVTKSKELNVTSIYECHFDTTYYGKTIITDWNLVCDRKYLANLLDTFYMIGGFSVLFSGYFGDRYGRRRCVMIFSIMLCLVMTISQILQSEKLFKFDITIKYALYCLTQFFTGALGFSLYTSSYVLLLELTTKPYHSIFSVMNLYLYVIGELISLCIGYFVKDWYIINWIMVAYSVFIMSIISLFLPESPKWLFTVGSYNDALKSIMKIAKRNNYNLVIDKKSDIKSREEFYEIFDKTLFNNNESMNSDGSTVLINTLIENTTNNDRTIQEMLKTILFPLSNFFKTISLAYIWFSVTLLYFGISLGVTSIDSINPFIIVLFSSFAEATGYSFCFLNKYLGHRRMNTVYMSVSALICLIIGLVPKSNSTGSSTIPHTIIIILLTVIGKAMVSASFNTCFIYSSSFYPTRVRNFALLFLSSIGCVGSIIAPEINLLADLEWKPIPFIVFSASAFIASFAAFSLKTGIIEKNSQN